MVKKKPSFSFSFKKNIVAVLIVIIIALAFVSYQNYSQVSYLNNRISQLESEKNSLQSQVTSLNSQINSLNSRIQTKESEISNLKYDIEQKKKEIQRLKTRISELEVELGITKVKLEETTELYEEAKPYQERVDRGQTLSQSYTLLSDYEDYAKAIILTYLGLSSPTAPTTDDELWERGRLIYNWLSNNYEYCGDKGLRVGNTFYQFQFYSPDELLMSDNARCGDCDDFATLFAGLMYASGVPESKVWVVCGSADGGGHCWNWLLLSDTTYRIDGVCSQKQELFGFLGLSWGIKGAYYTSTKGSVDCFSEYDAQIRMNPINYYSV